MFEDIIYYTILYIKKHPNKGEKDLYIYVGRTEHVSARVNMLRQAI